MSSSSNSSKGESGNTKQIPPAKHWCFTLNNYKEDDINSIVEECSNSSKRYVFQEEKGEEGTIHLQGYIEFNTKLRPKNLFNNKIHWEKTRDIKASIKYCSKEDTRIGRIFKYNIIIPKPLKLITKNIMYPWQLEILNIIEEEPDDRSIYWFWENKGKAGKTQFTKYMIHHHHALVVSGKATDMKFMIVKFEEQFGAYPEIIIMDLPRATCQETIDYAGFEKIKDGVFMSSKYECVSAIYNPPHFFVFANEEPTFEMMSEDRWRVKEIKN